LLGAVDVRRGDVAGRVNRNRATHGAGHLKAAARAGIDQNASVSHEFPQCLFLLNPAYCGSTAFALFLLSSSKALGLNEHAEGQWLATVRGDMESDRWSTEKPLPWKRIKSEWFKAWHVRRVDRPQACVLVEKSPPNLVRAREIER
jgi:hypothetical protein